MSATALRNKTIGVIDIGSNSVRLMVVETRDGEASILHRNMITSRLLSGALNGVLKDESIFRTVNAINELVKEAESYGAQTISAFGTCAMREGINSAVIIEEVRRASGVEIDVLSGSDEAKVAYMGVSATGENGIIDIGGGSTELTVGENAQVKKCLSVPIGAVRLSEAGIAVNAKRLIDVCEEKLSPAWDAFKDYGVKTWTGVGGTITSLAAMSLELKEYSSERVNGFTLYGDKVMFWLDRLCSLTLDERKSITGLKQNRADIIPFGAAILVAFFKLSNLSFITVTDNDNLLGYLKLKYGIN